MTSPTSTSSSASAAPSDPRRLAHFIKAYDVRGVVPEQLDEDVASAIGAAFARVVVKPEGASGVVVGHDMRPSSPSLSRAFAEGVASHGVDVTLIGLCSTDGLYYASGALDLPGAMSLSFLPAQPPPPSGSSCRPPEPS